MEVIGHLHVKPPVPTEQEVGWASEAIWMKEENLAKLECPGGRLVSLVFLLSHSARKWAVA